MNTYSPKLKIVLIGYSGHAYVIIDVLMKSKIYILGYMEPDEKSLNPCGLSYLGDESRAYKYLNLADTRFFICVGENLLRNKIYNILTQQLFLTINVIHPNSDIGFGLQIGEGNVIMAGAVIQPLVKIGNCSIINTSCVIEHECVIGNFVHIAPGAVLTGNVKIGDNSLIGANSVVRQGVKIGNNVTIGAGCVILRDVPDGVTYVGNPGKLLA